MWSMASGPFLRRFRLFPLLLLFLGALWAFSLTENKPYHKTYALSPRQVLENLEFLKGETIMVTGYVAFAEGRLLTISGHAGEKLKIRTPSQAPQEGTEVIARVQLPPISGALEAQEIYEYHGSTIHRVIFSTFPIPIIAFLFLREFKFHIRTFTFRRRHDLD